MPFSGKSEPRTNRRSGRFPKRGLLALILLVKLIGAQTPPKPSTKKSETHRANELTLAGLRPGRDKTALAITMYRQPTGSDAKQDSQLLWPDSCRMLMLAVDFDTKRSIQVVRVTRVESLVRECGPVPPSAWKTGNGLRIGDPVKKLAQVYGEPDSRSPSTKDGQPLELWYYAFDWAGADVPQVMEVLCTKEANGNPGRVVEITLAAPSL
jgi:hypothetical protein